MLVSDLPAAVYLGFALVLGATWGSFFNVAIFRWPRDLSVVSPPSTCPACGTRIPASRNVPILAYLLQRGRAACCGAKLTPRYVVVEILSALLLMALTARFVVHADEDTPLFWAVLETGSWFVLVGGLVIATFADLETMQIPDEVSIGGTALGLATLTLRPAIDPVEAALGAGLGYLFVQIVFVSGWERLTGRRGMGEADPKLLLFIGTFLGWQGVVFALFAGAVQGLLAVGLGVILGRPITTRVPEAALAPDGELPPPADPETLEGATKDAEKAPTAEAAADAAEGTEAPSAPTEPSSPDAASAASSEGPTEGEPGDEGVRQILPFGPLLSLGAIEFLFFGDALIDWYLRNFV